MTEGQTNTPPSLKTLLLLTLGTGIAATVLTLLVVLPAEFGRDPTGFGRVTGLDLLAPAHEHAIEIASGPGTPVQFQETPFRSDVIEIPLVAKGDKSGRYDLEYKVLMTAGQTMVYSWQSEGIDDDEIYYDLHAETPGPEVKVVAFKQARAAAGHGSLTAPIDGYHGWYFENRSKGAMKVKLKLSGFYELIPPGETGNKAGITPSPPEGPPTLASSPEPE